MEKLCLFCKHFYFNPGQPDYSEYTPGYDASFGCGLSIWDNDSVYDEYSYRACQLKARTCPKFEQVNLEEVI